MADGDEIWGCLGVVLAVIAVTIAVATAIALLTTAGVVYGAGTAVYNYALAFRGNVRPERIAR